MREHPGHGNPDDAVREVFAAMSAEHWSAVAALAHPDALASFKMNALKGALEQEERREAQQRSYTEDPDHMVPPSDPPYFYKQMYGVSTVAELESLSPQALVARFTEIEWQGSHPHASRVAGATTDVSGSIRREVLGHVLESDDTAHVVYRQRLTLGNGSEYAIIRTMTMKLWQGSWYSFDWQHLPNSWRPLSATS